MLNFLQRIRSVWFPDEYHGWGRTKRYFEGWYFKLVSADEQHALAIIPGISMSDSGEQQAFVQVMDGKACQAYYFPYPAQQFLPSLNTFQVQVGGSWFSKNHLALDLPNLRGEVRFQDRQPWPKMLGAPGIMGWYSFVPFMECNHGVVSLNHQLSGVLEKDGKQLDFSGGKGYIEKDWGRSFPRAYVWMQSNHFGQGDRASLMASVAHIPWLNGHFIGFISGFWLDGKLYKFATYTGARQQLKVEKDQVSLVFKSPGLELRILARQARGASLLSPMSGAMTGKIQESLLAEMEVELFKNGQKIYEGNGRNAGLEVAGDIDVLM